MGKRGACNLCQIKLSARHIFNEQERSAGQRSFAPIEWGGDEVVGCSIRAAGRLFPSNCYFLDASRAAFRQNAVELAEHRRITSPKAQILAQSPELVDC
jgi:hypothetical protein